MTEIQPDFRPSRDEPAVLSPELEIFVAAARSTPVPEVRVTIDAISRGVEQRRRRRRFGVGASIAAAAALVLVVATQFPEKTGEVAPEVDEATVAATTVAASQKTSLHAGITVRRLDGADPVYVQSTYAVELGQGHYRVEVRSPLKQAIQIRAGEQTLELVHGVIDARVSGQRFEAALESGVAHWVAEDVRTPVPVQTNAEVSPEALVRRADRAMAAGTPTEAIAALERLVATYPHHPATTTGMLDLARLYRRSEQPAQARCMYTKILDRPAAKAVHPEVQAALERLGPGAGCREDSPTAQANGTNAAAP